METIVGHYCPEQQMIEHVKNRNNCVPPSIIQNKPECRDVVRRREERTHCGVQWTDRNLCCVNLMFSNNLLPHTLWPLPRRIYLHFVCFLFLQESVQVLTSVVNISDKLFKTLIRKKCWLSKVNIFSILNNSVKRGNNNLECTCSVFVKYWNVYIK